MFTYTPRFSVAFLLTATATAIAISGCVADDGSGIEGATSDMSSSELADEPALDAVGAVDAWRTDGGWDCTGVLVAPNLVLSSRSCVAFSEAASFSFDKHLTRPDGSVTRERRRYTIRGTITTGRDAGGFSDVGRDAALYVLEEPILDVAPMPIRSRVLDASDEGRVFTMVGYGGRQVGPRVPRRKALATLDAVTGRPYARAFATEETFRTFMSANTSARFADRIDYHRALDEDGYEAHVGLAPSGVADNAMATCDGPRHPGAPLLERVGDGWELVGITTRGEYTRPGNLPDPEPLRFSCFAGTFLTKAGPGLQEVLRRSSADPSSPMGWACQGRSGRRCDGDTVVSCDIQGALSTSMLHVEDCAEHEGGFTCVDGVARSCGRSLSGPAPAFDDDPSTIWQIFTVGASKPRRPWNEIPGTDERRGLLPSTCALYGSGEVRCWGPEYPSGGGGVGRVILTEAVRRGENISCWGDGQYAEHTPNSAYDPGATSNADAEDGHRHSRGDRCCARRHVRYGGVRRHGERGRRRNGSSRSDAIGRWPREMYHLRHEYPYRDELRAAPPLVGRVRGGSPHWTVGHDFDTFAPHSASGLRCGGLCDRGIDR
jgi:hypothetical protein